MINFNPRAVNPYSTMSLTNLSESLEDKLETERGRKIHGAAVLAILFIALWTSFVLPAPATLRGGFLLVTSLVLMVATPRHF